MSPIKRVHEGLTILLKYAPEAERFYYWTSELDGCKHYDCFCSGCGVQTKGRDAGEDEGTEYEWCGSCRH